MRILLVHNRYQQAGGEDAVFDAERALLRREGNEVREFVRDNKDIKGLSLLAAAGTSIWSRQTYRDLQKVLAAFHPDVAHFHNTFMLISPAAYYACQKMGVPVVQTLHNYRLLCPAATFLREGRVCEDCVGKTPPWPGILHGCWRGSRTQTAVVASMLTTHRLLGTWKTQVDRYIALTDFARKKFVSAGLPSAKIVVKPNFVLSDPAPGPGLKRSHVLFAARLSPEKGIGTMLKAWQKLGNIPLKIAGDGPIMDFVTRHALPAVELLGWRAHEEILDWMKRARFLIFPSEAYEGFPLTIAEAFACGTPVIASNLGAMAEIVTDGQTGLHFEVGNIESMAERVAWAWAHPKEMDIMGRNARQEYEEKYTAKKNHTALIGIYEDIVAKRGG